MSRNALHDGFFSRMRRETGAKWGDYYAKQADKIIGELFPQQLALRKDPCRTKAALCPRRAGKSRCSVAYMLDVALRKPEAQVLYITLTRGKAKEIIWTELKKLNRSYELVDPTRGFNETELMMKLENYSTIRLAGCETVSDVEKFRGGQYDLVIIDECASMSAELFMSLVDDAISPALSDREGTLLIIGTPGRVLAGPFYAATSGKSFVVGEHPERPGHKFAVSRPYKERSLDKWDDVTYSWSFHSWMTKDNVAKPKIWEDQQLIKLRNGWGDDHPQWRREYLGQWVADDTGFVYRYSPERNDWTPNPDAENQWGLPDGHEWRFVLGMDLGYDDDFAIEVAAWSETCPDFYHMPGGFSMPGLDVQEIAKKVIEYQERYGEFDVMVGDRGGLGKLILATLANQYGLDIEAAEKTEKRDHIELLNTDLLHGRCHIAADSILGSQMSILQWDEKNPKIEERDTPNHAADAFLYVWRYCYHHFSRKRHIEIQPGSSAYWAEKMREAADKAAEKKLRWIEMEWDERISQQHKLDEGPLESSLDWELN